jgi:hypothetical protein
VLLKDQVFLCLFIESTLYKLAVIFDVDINCLSPFQLYRREVESVSEFINQNSFYLTYIFTKALGAYGTVIKFFQPEIVEFFRK